MNYVYHRYFQKQCKGYKSLVIIMMALIQRQVYLWWWNFYDGVFFVFLAKVVVKSFKTGFFFLQKLEFVHPYQ